MDAAKGRRTENDPGVGAPGPFVSELPAVGGLGRQPRFLHSGGLFAAISLDLCRALRLRLCGIADRLSQHLAQLRLCLCRFPFGWLPLGHASYVGMQERELNPARIIYVRSCIRTGPTAMSAVLLLLGDKRKPPDQSILVAIDPEPTSGQSGCPGEGVPRIQ